MKNIALSSLALLLITACSDQAAPRAQVATNQASQPEGQQEEDSLASIMEDHWALVLEENPVLAEQLGEASGRGRLPDASLEAYAEGVEARRALLARLNELEGGNLAPEEDLNRRLLMTELEDEIESSQTGGRYLTITTYSAPHLGFVRLAERASLRRREDIDSYLARLDAMPDAMDAVIARLSEAVDEGWTQPCKAMEGHERTYRTHLVGTPEESAFYAPLTTSDRATDADRESAARLIEEGVLPAFQRFAAFYEGTYRPACRQDVGASSFPGGEDFYAYRTRSYTTTDMTPDEVHEVGLSEVARIRAEMEEVAGEAGFADLASFQQYLRTDPKFYPETAEERLAAASVIAKKMDGKLVELFTVLPRMPYDIQPIPLDVAEGTTTAYYSGPAADGTRGGTYWLNTTKLETRPLYELEALTLHEAVPGHHLQVALTQELDLPEFRRFGGFTAFTEGWGLYSERLGLETGFYDAPETDFGRLSYEMWRACRLVVDTGMHAKGWSRQEAIDYMLENTGLSENNITREVDRYITWPGQALAYKIGELKIRELRERAESELGESFDVRRFHDAVLANGALPLSILEEEIERFIEEEQENAGRG
ncbi:DUF885 domain-containing protein [Parvularcula maris]|uniref:DUF885 domain-containing protein n=1 Tax=Parvularcula maris TaxID=2965077 RepID=A0A9X2L6J8_9PROT|nr:DUF885 domain-containing protein [Parvularcula maris]MCQ8183881.1 DUF885 domain-containing protein [Parvularcula maris]